MVKINWKQQAKNDLISIAEYISKNSKKYARMQVQHIRERTRQLRDHPKVRREVTELDNPRI